MSRHAPSLVLAVTALTLAACDGDDGIGPDDPPPAPSFDLVFDRRAATLPLAELYVLPRAEGVARRVLPPATPSGEPSPSADGRLIAFVGAGPSEDDPQDLWIMRADGSERRRIPVQGGIEYAPALSPDGTRIAFIRVGDDDRSRLFVANVDGTNERQLVGQLAYPFRATPAWSPDGSRIAFAAGDPGALSLFVVGASGVGVEQLTESDGWSDFDPTWAPDGGRLAFTRTVGPRRATIVVVDLTTFAERTIVPLAQNRHPAWSPDGARIAFVSAMDGGADQELYTVKPDGTGLVRLTSNDVDERRPAWLTRSE